MSAVVACVLCGCISKGDLDEVSAEIAVKDVAFAESLADCDSAQKLFIQEQRVELAVIREAIDSISDADIQESEWHAQAIRLCEHWQRSLDALRTINERNAFVVRSILEARLDERNRHGEGE